MRLDECLSALMILYGQSSFAQLACSRDECICDVGWTGDGHNCTDVDECESGTHYCHVDADCDNMPGTFNCVRRTGYPESESETRRIKREDVTGSGDNIDSDVFQSGNCYQDSTSRILPSYKGKFVDNHSSRCIAACNGFNYAGLQNSVECWCGDMQPSSTLHRPGECPDVCPGNANEKCGDPITIWKWGPPIASGRCGPAHNADCQPDGNVRQNPECCSPGGYCGLSAAHCDCRTCVDFRPITHEGIPEGVLQWHGDPSIATVRLLAGTYGHEMNGGSENAMFDNEFGQDHMYHSSQCAAVAQGVEVTFINQITLADFLIHTRRDCCRHRYHNVCLYADGVKISCTPSSNYNPGDVINFMDFRISGKFPIIASSFKLQWDGPPDCVQINELFIYYTGATLCTGTGMTNLISAVCDHVGFTITVDETCRAANYWWLDWRSTFIDGNSLVVKMPSYPGTSCLAIGTGAAWEYTVGFSECNLVAPVLSSADANGIKWHVYSLYLNYDNAIDPAQGIGNLQQLDQTLVQCRIPANLQENAMSGTVTITDTADLIPDESSDVDLWSNLRLDVLSGGTSATASYSSTLFAGSSIGLGEHVKLQINDVAPGTMTTDYNIAIKDCWASTVANPNLTTDPTPAPSINFDATGLLVTTGAAYQTIKFYETQCPIYNWVTGVTTASSTDTNLEIELRQFAFNGDVSNLYYHCEIDVCIKTSPSIDNDRGDCVPADTLETCATLTSNSPTGRRRRAILSKEVTQNTTGSTGNSGEFKIDWSPCAETDIDEYGIVTCIKFKKDGSNAKAVSFSFITAALICSFY